VNDRREVAGRVRSRRSQVTRADGPKEWGETNGRGSNFPSFRSHAVEGVGRALMTERYISEEASSPFG
jgi:hypothetical protein